MSQVNIETLVIEATSNFTRIISKELIRNNYKKLDWGDNGLGDRWANKKFNYTVIRSNIKNPTTLYSENDIEEIPPNILNDFLKDKHTHKGPGIIGIFVHSKRTNVPKRPISKFIHKEITSFPCVVCGTRKTVCDHKNDLYNDPRVLNSKTQLLTDFQPLCNHCNLQKRQVAKTEENTNRLYSAKNIKMLETYPFEFPWEKKVYDKKDIFCKIGTFWYDPIKFLDNINCYSRYVIPVVKEIKMKRNKGEINFVL